MNYTIKLIKIGFPCLMLVVIYKLSNEGCDWCDSIGLNQKYAWGILVSIDYYLFIPK